MDAITSQPGWQDTTIPYMLHGDGAVFTFKNQQKLLSINVKSPVCDNRFSPHIIPLFSIVETVRCKLKEGYLTDSLTDVWAHVLQVLYYIQFQSSLLYCVLLRSTALYCSLLHYTTTYCTILHYTLLYCTILSNTILSETTFNDTILGYFVMHYTVSYCSR